MVRILQQRRVGDKMIMILETPFGYHTYNIDNLWNNLSQMGDVNVNLDTN